jgi:hypothetical protein
MMKVFTRPTSASDFLVFAVVKIYLRAKKYEKIKRVLFLGFKMAAFFKND